MKYLQDYIEDKQSEAFEKAGAFFAFNQDQFLEKRVEGVKYTLFENMGLFCRKDKADWLMKELERIGEQGIQQDIKENGIDNIIKRELYNHEAFYTMSIAQTKDSLEEYNIPVERIKKVFNQELKANY
jgi:hypothetical protein